MTLRKLVTERILFAVDSRTLMRNYAMTEDGLQDLSDLDLLELYEDVVFDTVE